jgi:hypothetical protein
MVQYLGLVRKKKKKRERGVSIMLHALGETYPSDIGLGMFLTMCTLYIMDHLNGFQNVQVCLELWKLRWFGNV